MASSNILLFDSNKQNMLSDVDYNASTYRANGVQSGIASSSLQNKFQYQVGLVCYAIAQMMVNNGLNALDSDSVTTFVNNLSSSVLQKVVDKATTAQAQAGTDTSKWMTPALTKAAIEAILWTKPQILSDAVKALFGLTSSATPDDVFGWLGNYNKYWWRRIPISYTIAMTDISSGTIGSSAQTMHYSSSVDIVDNAITLNNSSTASIAISATGAQDMVSHAPCYYYMGNNSSTIRYLPTGSTAGTSTSNTIRYNSSQSRLEYGSTASIKAKTCAITHSYGSEGYVSSSTRSEYPDSGESGGYKYEYVGQPMSSLPKMVKLETGAYVGTGTYGESNPNSITFEFTPKLVLIYRDNVNSGIPMLFPYIWGEKYFYVGSNITSGNYQQVTVSINGNVMSWYAAGNASYQLNQSGDVYHYIALE